MMESYVLKPFFPPIKTKHKQESRKGNTQANVCNLGNQALTQLQSPPQKKKMQNGKHQETFKY